MAEGDQLSVDVGSAKIAQKVRMSKLVDNNSAKTKFSIRRYKYCLKHMPRKPHTCVKRDYAADLEVSISVKMLGESEHVYTFNTIYGSVAGTSRINKKYFKSRSHSPCDILGRSCRKRCWLVLTNAQGRIVNHFNVFVVVKEDNRRSGKRYLYSIQPLYIWQPLNYIR